jgi:hypothetical protein
MIFFIYQCLCYPDADLALINIIFSFDFHSLKAAYILKTVNKNTVISYVYDKYDKAFMLHVVNFVTGDLYRYIRLQNSKANIGN